ncbi:MAG: Fe-S cluster assembly sulfur transfer protein SufU [bacterium]
MALAPPVQDLLMEHYQHPRNFGTLDAPTHRVCCNNPLCGDRIELQLTLSASNRIQAIRFYGRGCVISQASASMMTEAVQGKSLTQALALSASFQNLFSSAAAERDSALGVLQVFEPIKESPSRLSCVFLAWQALALCLPVENESDVHPS